MYFEISISIDAIYAILMKLWFRFFSGWNFQYDAVIIINIILYWQIICSILYMCTQPNFIESLRAWVIKFDSVMFEEVFRCSEKHDVVRGCSPKLNRTFGWFVEKMCLGEIYFWLRKSFDIFYFMKKTRVKSKIYIIAAWLYGNH